MIIDIHLFSNLCNVPLNWSSGNTHTATFNKFMASNLTNKDFPNANTYSIESSKRKMSEVKLQNEIKIMNPIRGNL